MKLTLYLDSSADIAPVTLKLKELPTRSWLEPRDAIFARIRVECLEHDVEAIRAIDGVASVAIVNEKSKWA